MPLENITNIFENTPFNKHLGIKFEKIEEDSMVCSIKITTSHLNVNNSVHGGVFFSILDSVMGATIRTVVNQPIVTVNMSINYFAPLMNGEEMMATAKILQLGNSIVTAEGLVEDSKGSVVAKSIGTFKIMRMNR
jgi:uncharacterized protein (TIGR00369 family)